MTEKEALGEGSGKEDEQNPWSGPVEDPLIDREKDAEGGGGLPLFDD